MAYFELKDSRYRIRVCSLGAELQSIYDQELKTEFMWQPGFETFDHHSILLFPNPGRINGDRIIAGGKVYPATMHGFASGKEFAVAEQTDTSLVLELRDDEHTRRYFPYAFCLRVIFRLEEGLLSQKFEVVNEGGEPMYYCLGAHPGFYCPIVLGESADDYSLYFDRPQEIFRNELEENTRLLTGKQIPYLQKQDRIGLSDRFFDGGPLLLGGVEADSVRLQSDKSGFFVEMGIRGFESMCLWGNPTRMSVICIEPWCGTSDRVDTDHIWEHKPGIRRVEPGQRGEHLLTFRTGKR